MDLQTITCKAIKEVRQSLQNMESQSFDEFLGSFFCTLMTEYSIKLSKFVAKIETKSLIVEYSSAKSNCK